MSSTRGRAALVLISQTARTLDTPLPADVADQLAEADELVTKAEAINGAALTDAVLDALAQGRDFRTDKAIAGHLIDFVLANQGIAASARGRADTQITNTLVEHGDRILASWAAAIAPHSAALAEAAESLPSDDLDNLAAVKAAGVQAFYHLGNAQHAVKLWAAAVQGFRQIAAAAHITITDKAAVLTATEVGGLPADPWVLARKGGVPLSLPSSLGEYMERVADKQQRQAAAAELEEQSTRQAASV